MFQDYYHFRKLFDKPAKASKYLISTTTYEFQTKYHKYLLNAEHYRYDIYVIKYFLKIHKNNNKKYNLLTNEGKCSRIIGTCLQVMLAIFKRNPKASFGFLGSHTLNLAERQEESRANTKRFRVYKYAIEDLFGSESFTHFMNAENSTYLMVNHKNDSVDDISEKAHTMFLELYPQLEGV